MGFIVHSQDQSFPRQGGVGGGQSVQFCALTEEARTATFTHEKRNEKEAALGEVGQEYCCAPL